MRGRNAGSDRYLTYAVELLLHRRISKSFHRYAPSFPDLKKDRAEIPRVIFPIAVLNFPHRRKNLPVQLHREFASKAPNNGNSKDSMGQACWEMRNSL